MELAFFFPTTYFFIGVTICVAVAGFLIALKSNVLALGRSGRRRLVKAECWFCSAVTVIPAGNENSFDCSECNQYNGFNKDGSYNKSLPAQYREDLNPAPSRPQAHSRDVVQTPNLLCDVCQTYQELKVQQLAAFVPTCEENFDAEVAEYSQYLEEAYRLCPACESHIHEKLRRQDTDIRSKHLAQRLNTSAQTNIQMVAPSATLEQRLVPLCRLLGVMAASLLVLSELGAFLYTASLPQKGQYWLMSRVFSLSVILESRRQNLSLIGLVCSISSTLMAGKYRLKYIDCVCPLLWTLYIGNITKPLSSSTSTSSSPPLFHAGVKAVLPWLAVDVISPSLAVLMLLACVKHALHARGQQPKKIYTRRVPTHRQPDVHSLQDSFDGAEEEDVVSQPGPSHLSPTAGNLDSMSPAQSLQSESGEIRRILLDQDIGGLSLGPRGSSRPRNKDLWTAHTPPTSRPTTPLSFDERPSSREFRPIISPATFDPSGLKRTASQSSFMSSFGVGCSSGFGLPFQEEQGCSSRERINDSGRGSHDDDSLDGSLPLGMSAKEHERQNPLHTLQPSNHQTIQAQGWLSFVIPCILGFSLGINCAAAVYFMYGR